MLNNLDIHPGTAVNRWIVGIKLFQFKVIHAITPQHWSRWFVMACNFSK